MRTALRYLFRICALTLLSPLLLLLFVILIDTQGNDAADDMVVVLQHWLHS